MTDHETSLIIDAISVPRGSKTATGSEDLRLIVRSHPFQVVREEGSGDTAIPNAFCWNAIISIIRHALITCTMQLYHQC